MPSNQSTHRFRLEELESYNRIINIPVVYRGWTFAESIYDKIKNVNELVHWTFDQAEISVKTAYETTSPAAILFQGPLMSIDKIICKSLDMVEDRVPSINLPPEMIYYNTKEYISEVGTKMIRPVLKRADSMKKMGNTVLASKYTEYAADKLDGALYTADAYVDKYLPPEIYDDQNNDEEDTYIDGPTRKAIHTIQHVDKFSRKLKRRITKKTLEEAKAIKEHSAEAINVFIYIAELVATDPKLAYQKGKELWVNLSKDEPENQARPENLEQLFVMLTRESARRLVHFVNYSSVVLSKLPKYAVHRVHDTTSTILTIADSAAKKVHLEGAEQVVIKVMKIQAHTVTILLKEINVYVSDILDQLDQNLSTPSENQSLVVPKVNVQAKAAKKNVNNGDKNNCNNDANSCNNTNNSINGTENM